MSYIINSASIGYGIDSYYDIDDQGNMSVRRDLDNPELVQEAKRNLPLVQRAKKEAELTRSYLLDVLGMHEGSRAIKEGPAEAFTRRKDFVVATSAMMFNQAERYNRQTIMVASYNLALEEVSKDFPDMPFSERAELAADTAMYETQELAGGNILETSPRLGQQFLGRAALMYKQFGLRMYTTMFKSAYSVIKNSFLAAVRSGTPRKEAARDAYIAYKQLVGLHGSAYLFAGVYGLPLYGAASLTYKLLDEFGLRELFAEAFDDEDETFGSPEAYNDFDTIVRTHIGEGHFKGPLNVLLDDLGIGIDVASRVRLTGLLIQENKFNPDANFDEMAMYYAGGAPLSVGKRVANGFKMIGEGEIERGTELLMPAALANPLKALGRYAEAGRIENRRGNPIYDDLTSGEIAAQVFGFAPAEYIRITEENQNLVRIDKAMAAKKTKLLRQYYFAVSQGNYDDVIEARQKIQDFNDRNPSFALAQKSITTSLRKNLEADREMEQYNGVRLSPNMKRAIDMNRADAESTLIPPKETPK